MEIDKKYKNIDEGVKIKRNEDDVGEGEKGLMFGYDKDENEECMKLKVVIDKKIKKSIEEMRRSGEIWWERNENKKKVKCE
jgi:S-adenosylmethionine synthetase